MPAPRSLWPSPRYALSKLAARYERTKSAPESPSTDHFDPLQLTPEASLNRTRIAALAGAEPRWIGRPAFDLLSSRALAGLAGSEGFAVTGPPEATVLSVAEALQHSEPTAVGVVEIYGKRLAHLIATLTTCASITLDDSPWRSAYLRHWAQVECVWLGGGLVAAFGATLLDATRVEAIRLGATCSIRLAPHPGAASLIGAARTQLRPSGRVVVLDFGHTAAKRGVATVTNGELARLDLLPSRPTPFGSASDSAESVTEFVIDTVSDAFLIAQRASGSVHPHVVASLASYLSNGRILDTHSLYAPLRVVEPPALDHGITRRLAAPAHLEFLHDGTAAARSLRAPGRNGRAALIALGTALGVGFAPPVDLLPLSPEFAVADVK